MRASIYATRLAASANPETPSNTHIRKISGSEMENFGRPKPNIFSRNSRKKKEKRMSTVKTRGVAGMMVIAREPMRHSNCSIWDGKWNCQAMRCKAPKMVATMGRTMKYNVPESAVRTEGA